MKKTLIMVFTFLFFTCAIGQEEILPFSPRGYITTGTSIQIWRIEHTNYKPVIQTAVPVELLVPVTRDFNVGMAMAFAHTDGNEITITGPTDAWVEGNYMLWDQKILLSAGLGVPVGITALNRDRFDLASWLGFSIFRFQVPVYGQGPAGKIGVSAAYPLFSRLIFGMGGQFLYRGEYTPVNYRYGQNLEHQFKEKFTPGNEVALNFGFDFSLTENQKLMFDGVITQYERDMLGDTPVYRAGRKLTLHGGYFLRYDEYYFIMMLTHRTAGKNEYIQGLSFREEALNGNGPQTELNLIWQPFRMEGGDLSILLDGKFYDENAYGNQWARTWASGFGGSFRISYTTLLQFHFKYHIGEREFVRQGKGNIEGMDAMLSMKYEF